MRSRRRARTASAVPPCLRPPRRTIDRVPVEPYTRAARRGTGRPPTACSPASAPVATPLRRGDTPTLPEGAPARPGRPGSLPVEASGCLVAPAVFKTDEAEQLGLAGSIPVRLRHLPRAVAARPVTARPRRTGRLGRVIRPATPADVPEIMAMIRELAEYEKAPNEVRTTEDDLRAALFRDDPVVFAHMAEDDATGEVAGYALWFLNFSTWRGQGIYLEDIYVRPHMRGAGHGRALL